MNQRCIHEIDVTTMSCINCGGNYWTVKNDPRPWSAIRKEREEKRNQQSFNKNPKENL